MPVVQALKAIAGHQAPPAGRQGRAKRRSFQVACESASLDVPTAGRRYRRLSLRGTNALI